MKRIIASLLIMFSSILFASITVAAQSLPADPAAQQKAAAPVVKSEELLKMRSLQYESAKRLVRMHQLQAEFEKLQNEQQSLAQQINAWIVAQAEALKVDLKKLQFDFDALRFVERPPQEKK
jgi:hypothetical protein